MSFVYQSGSEYIFGIYFGAWKYQRTRAGYLLANKPALFYDIDNIFFYEIEIGNNS